MMEFLAPQTSPERDLSLLDMEMLRLSSLNSRTLCITFPYSTRSSIPSSTTLMSLNSSIQSLVFARRPLPWCFMIFPTMRLKMEAEMQLDKKKYGKEVMVVDKTRMFVPVQADELEVTRDCHSLAVHGIPAGTKEDDMKVIFPRAEQVTIAKRGGSAFLTYVSKDECEEDFLTFEDAEVKGVSVVVMFGHWLGRTDRQVDKLRDQRDKLEVCRNRESLGPLLHFFEEIRSKKKNGSEDVEDSSSLAEMNKVLLSSSLRMDRMRKQVRRSKGEEEIMDIKIGWLDQLVARACVLSDLSGSEVSGLERGGWREMVEMLWKYFDTREEEEWGRGSERRKDGECRRSDNKMSTGGCSYRREGGRRDRSRSLEWRRRGQESRQPEKRGVDGRRQERYRRSQRSWSRSKTARSERYDHKGLATKESRRCHSEISMKNNHYQLARMKDNIVVKVLEKPGNRLDNDLVNNNSSLASYLEKKLCALGLKEDTLVLEADKIMVTIRQVVEDVGMLSSMQQAELVKLLHKFGFKSGHVSERLAADLVVKWALKDEEGRDSIAGSEGRIVNEVEVDEDNDQVEVIPSEIMGVEEGFPRMALVMAFFLHTERDLEEQISRDLARAMVGVWITYGFTYQQMCEVCQSRDQHEVKVDMLRSMLNTKVFEGFPKPGSFGFSKLIKLTLFYFSHAV